MADVELRVPLDVPEEAVEAYRRNYAEITKGSGRLMLFAGDQKIEHLNDDFFGSEASEDDAEPEHLFRIASRARIGVFATQIGLIARFGGGLCEGSLLGEAQFEEQPCQEQADGPVQQPACRG